MRCPDCATAFDRKSAEFQNLPEILIVEVSRNLLAFDKTDRRRIGMNKAKDATDKTNHKLRVNQNCEKLMLPVNGVDVTYSKCEIYLTKT